MENKTNEYIKQIAEILEAGEESIEYLPEEIKDSMQAVFETLPAETDEQKAEIYDALDELWQKGIVITELKEISLSTGISFTTLENLDYETQKELVYEFMMDSSQNERFFSIVNKGLALSEIMNIANFLSVSVSKIKALPVDTQIEMCSVYAMEYDEDGSNAELLDRLRETELIGNE